MLQILYSSPLKPGAISNGYSSLGGYVSGTQFQNNDPHLFPWVIEDKINPDNFKALFIKNLLNSPVTLNLWTPECEGYDFELSLVQPASHPSCNCPWIETIYSVESPPLVSEFQKYTEQDKLVQSIPGGGVLGLWIKRRDLRSFGNFNQTGILGEGVWGELKELSQKRLQTTSFSLIIDY